MSILHGLVILGALASITFAALFLSYRRRLYMVLGRDLGFPIPTIALKEFDPRFVPGPFGVSLDAEVWLLPELGRVVGGVNERELWILGALAKGARCLFEFGTATGRTTYVMARNATPDAVVGTLTLAPEQVASYASVAGDSRTAAHAALDETRFRSFVYSGTEVESRVRQYFGDSKAFDDTDWLGRCDLVFIDGSHAYSYIQSDTQKAFRMVKSGGIVLWHDYRGSRGSTRDVYRFLNELRATHPLVRLAGTRIVAWRAPAAE